MSRNGNPLRLMHETHQRVPVERTNNMKYMLLMNGTKADFEWYTKWEKKDFEAHIAFMHTFNKELIDSGAFVAAEGLAFPNEAKLVRAGRDGEPITDGIFPESKEFLAGYWIVDVASPEEAYRLAAKVSAAPGCKERGNQPLEVRQVMSGPPEDFA